MSGTHNWLHLKLIILERIHSTSKKFDPIIIQANSGYIVDLQHDLCHEKIEYSPS